MTDDAMLSRRPDSKVEIRMEVDQSLAAGLDGIAMGRGISRNELIRELATREVDAAVHAATVLLRVTGINPWAPEGGRTVDSYSEKRA